MKNKQELVGLLSAFALIFQNAKAEVDGRWYSLEEHNSSEKPSVIWLILAIIAAIILLKLVFSDDSNKEDRGCITIFIVVMVVMGILAFIYWP